ncbi:MAG: HEAT repeat domain-containing protein [Bacteroidota bacterium]
MKILAINYLRYRRTFSAVIPSSPQIFWESNDYSELFLWAVGNALCEIDDKESYTQIIEICNNSALGISRQMLFLKTLPKIKNPKAHEVLLEGLTDKNVRGHALDGLGKLGNTAAIGTIEKIEVEKGKYEFKAKERALKKLKKKNSRQQGL